MIMLPEQPLLSFRKSVTHFTTGWWVGQAFREFNVSCLRSMRASRDLSWLLFRCLHCLRLFTAARRPACRMSGSAARTRRTCIFICYRFRRPLIGRMIMRLLFKTFAIPLHMLIKLPNSLQARAYCIGYSLILIIQVWTYIFTLNKYD